MLSKLKDMFSINEIGTYVKPITTTLSAHSSEPLVIRINKPITTKEHEKFSTTLRELGVNAILIPSYMEAIQTKVNDYRIFTIEDYKKYKLSISNAKDINRNTVKGIEENFNKISKGYNFIIGVGKDNLMFYSIPYFDIHVLGNKDSQKTLKTVCTNNKQQREG